MEEHAVGTSRWTPTSGGLTVVRLAQIGLVASIVLLVAAPLAIPPGYSVVDHTLSESGGQGVDGAWIMRSGVLLTSISVFALISVSALVWSALARLFLSIYATALLFLVIFPESPWTDATHDAFVAWLHTASGVVGGIAFILGAFLVFRSRPEDDKLRRAHDWIVMASIALIPQVMLVLPADGVLQRLMVAIGFTWLLAESARIASSHRVARPATAPVS